MLFRSLAFFFGRQVLALGENSLSPNTPCAVARSTSVARTRQPIPPSRSSRRARRSRALSQPLTSTLRKLSESQRPAGRPGSQPPPADDCSLARSLRMISTSPNKDLIWVAFRSARRLPRGGSDRRVREPSRKRKVSHCNLCPRMRSPTHLTRAQPTYSHTRLHQAATKNAVNVALFAEINTSRCLRMKTCYPGRFSI